MEKRIRVYCNVAIHHRTQNEPADEVEGVLKTGRSVKMCACCHEAKIPDACFPTVAKQICNVAKACVSLWHAQGTCFASLGTGTVILLRGMGKGKGGEIGECVGRKVQDCPCGFQIAANLPRNPFRRYFYCWEGEKRNTGKLEGS